MLELYKKMNANIT